MQGNRWTGGDAGRLSERGLQTGKAGRPPEGWLHVPHPSGRGGSQGRSDWGKSRGAAGPGGRHHRQYCRVIGRVVVVSCRYHWRVAVRRFSPSARGMARLPLSSISSAAGSRPDFAWKYGHVGTARSQTIAVVRCSAFRRFSRRRSPTWPERVGDCAQCLGSRVTSKSAWGSAECRGMP
jgi:hypothetical protein